MVPANVQELALEELAKANHAFDQDPLLRVSQAAIFISQRLSFIAALVIKDRLSKAGVKHPDIALRGMLRDQELITATIGPFNMERLETEIDQVLPHYIATLHAAGVNLADLDKSNDDGKPKPPANDNSGASRAASSGDGGSRGSGGHPSPARSRIIIPE